MCNQSCLDFGYRNLLEPEIRDRAVVEVGARNVNGSLRPYLQSFHPSRYLGVDIFPGEGVDDICNADRLVERYGAGSFDVLICTEMLEHSRDWHRTIENFKQVLRPGGVLLITTRSKGFPFHEAPHDYWRYELDDMRAIFSDFTIEVLESDPEEPGVFLKARKPPDYTANDLAGHRLYSMLTRSYVHSVEPPEKSKYEGKLIRRQGNTPEDGKVYLVREGLRQWVIDAAWIHANGFRWPDDVTVIEADELDRIPLGDPLVQNL
jgi:SAM-dependent methyltransferase